MYKFFTSKIETLEELRKEYKRLVFLHHPDHGGRTEDMQQINSEYDALLKVVGNRRRSATGETYEKAEYHAEFDRFREIIEKVIHFNVTIEICGTWLWILNGYEYRKDLKEIGFFWCSRKKAWAWTDEPSTSKHKLTMDEIREAYGSEIVREKKSDKLLNGVA